MLIAFVALAAVALQPDIQAREATAIAAAKKVSVHQLDPSLPRKPFIDWLNATVGTDAQRTWEVNDCGEQTGSGKVERDIPLCAEVDVVLPGKRRLIVSLSVGTHETGVSKTPPSVFWAAVVEADGAQKSVPRLSAVSASLRSPL
jgi:hypothetical protein